MHAPVGCCCSQGATNGPVEWGRSLVLAHQSPVAHVRFPGNHGTFRLRIAKSVLLLLILVNGRVGTARGRSSVDCNRHLVRFVVHLLNVTMCQNEN